MENKNDIDWLNTVGEDDIDEVIEPLNGVYLLLDGLARIHDDGFTPSTKYAYHALQVVVAHIGKELEQMKPKLDYMDSKMREVKNELVLSKGDINV